MAGTTVEALGSFAPSAASDKALVLLRITMEPGASIPFHQHPGAVVVTVASGTFGTEFQEGEGTLTRADGTSETVSAGASATMQAGDSLAYEGALHTMANEGDETLILVVAALLDPNQPGFMFEGMDMDGEDDGQDGDGQDGESG
jgi:quercetin dioxygenase-like cupin family protein